MTATPPPSLISAVGAADKANQANLAALGTLQVATDANNVAAAQVRDADVAVGGARNAVSAALTALEAAAAELDAAAAITQTAAGKVVTAAGQMTTANDGAQAAGKALSDAGTLLANEALKPWPAEPPPPVVTPPVPPVVTPPIVVPATYGCPVGIALKAWTYAPVTGAGRPAGVPEWKSGMRMSGVDFYGKGDVLDDKGQLFQTELGIASGYYGDQVDVELRDSIIRKTKKWGARLHKVKSYREINVTTLDGVDEHDRYIEPITNGFTRAQNQAAFEAALAGGTVDMAKVCFLLRNGRSERAASQGVQSAQRDRDGLTAAQMGECGLIWIDRYYGLNHARHKVDGGSGGRQSQFIKVFHGEKGPEGSATPVLYKGFVLVQDVYLDDSMQTYSFGALMFGANLGTVVRRSTFLMGSLVHPGDEPDQEAIRIENATGLGAGLLLIEDCTFHVKGGGPGRGFHLYDLTRPVEFRNVKSNVPLMGPSGQTLASPSAEGVLNYKQGA